MEQRRRNRAPAVVCKASGDVLDVRGETDRLLDDQDGTLGLAIRECLEHRHGPVIGVDDDLRARGHGSVSPARLATATRQPEQLPARGVLAQEAALVELMLKSGIRNAGIAVRFIHSPNSRPRVRTGDPASVARARRSTGLSLKRKLLTAATTSPRSIR